MAMEVRVRKTRNEPRFVPHMAWTPEPEQVMKKKKKKSEKYTTADDSVDIDLQSQGK